MSGYAVYPEYRDSGVEWIGVIPRHWSIQPLFGVARAGAKKNLDGKEINVLSLSYGKIVRRDVDKNFGLLPESFNTYQIVQPGQLILRLTDLQNDKRSLRVGYVTETGIITSAYLKLATDQRSMQSWYCYYLLHSYDKIKVFYGMGGGLRQSMKFDDMRRLPLLVPPLEEQQKIANFLDHETAKIDTLIEKQQQLIKLLKEKRQAVISHAVTKGLNPDAPMKDSGVEWLGEVPEHWTVVRIKNLSTVISKGATPSTIGGDLVDSGIRFLKAENIGKSEHVAAKPQFYIDKEVDRVLERSRLEENDVLVIIAGATTGSASVLERELLPANTNQAVSFIRPKNTSYSHYILHWLSTKYAQRIIWSGAVQAAQPNLSMEDLGNVPILMPTVNDLEELLGILKQELSKLDKLNLTVLGQVRLLQERRTALISAAVTGKIDVRNWQPPADTSTPSMDA